MWNDQPKAMCATKNGTRSNHVAHLSARDSARSLAIAPWAKELVVFALQINSESMPYGLSEREKAGASVGDVLLHPEVVPQAI